VRSQSPFGPALSLRRERYGVGPRARHAPSHCCRPDETAHLSIWFWSWLGRAVDPGRRSSGGRVAGGAGGAVAPAQAPPPPSGCPGAPAGDRQGGAPGGPRVPRTPGAPGAHGARLGVRATNATAPRSPRPRRRRHANPPPTRQRPRRAQRGAPCPPRRFAPNRVAPRRRAKTLLLQRFHCPKVPTAMGTSIGTQVRT
jgi:hypothetical protein